MKRVICIAALASALLSLPAAAVAAGPSLPAPKKGRVVVPLSIAGVSLGTKLSAARKAWGQKRGKCMLSSGRGVCRYGEPYTAGGDAEIGIENGKVRSITVRSYTEEEGTSFEQIGAGLKKMRTAEGFGLGSNIADVERKYPKGKRREVGTSIRYEIQARAGTFSFAARADGRVTLFALVAGTTITVR